MELIFIFWSLISIEEETSWIKKIMNFLVDGTSSQGRLKLRWTDAVNSDLFENCLSLSLTCDRLKWSNAIKPVIQQIGLQPH